MEEEEEETMRAPARGGPDDGPEAEISSATGGMTRVLDIRAECFADDVEVRGEMRGWSDEQLRVYFESGGLERPA